MGDVMLLDFRLAGDGEPVPAEERRGVLPFRGRSLHRNRKCRCSEAIDPGASCPICEWGAFICVHCSAAEGEVPTDCPRRRMTEEECTAVHEGRLDYIVAAGGWVVDPSFSCAGGS